MKFNPPAGKRFQVSSVQVNSHREWHFVGFPKGLRTQVDLKRFIVYIEPGTGVFVAERKTRELMRELDSWAG